MIKSLKMIKATNDNISQLVLEGISIYGPNADLNYIDTSDVTNMMNLFNNTYFNGDISKWDVSNVSNMTCMFRNSIFNKPLNKWKLYKYLTYIHMFIDSNYDQEITWDVDLKDLFGDSYNDYMERRRLKVLKDLCI